MGRRWGPMGRRWGLMGRRWGGPMAAYSSEKIIDMPLSLCLSKASLGVAGSTEILVGPYSARGPSVMVVGMQNWQTSFPRHGPLVCTSPLQHGDFSPVISNISLPGGVHVPSDLADFFTEGGWQYLQRSLPRHGVSTSTSPGQHLSATGTLLSKTSVPATVQASPTFAFGTQNWQISLPRQGELTCTRSVQHGSALPESFSASAEHASSDQSRGRGYEGGLTSF